MPDSTRELWFLRWLDHLLSEPLRQASPLEHSRARVTGGIALLFMVMGLLFFPFSFLTLPNRWLLVGLNGITMLGHASTLLLLRRSSTARPAALVLCTVMALTYVPTNLLMNDPTVGIHAVSMLLPLISIYLLGARLGLIISGYFALCSLVVFPLYFKESTTDFPRFWGSHFFAALTIIGGWAIGRLNSAARDAAHASLEQTMKELHESQRQLTSLIESTDDVVFSVDVQGRLLIVNPQASRSFQQRSGLEGLHRGEPFIASLAPEIQEKWRKRVDQALAGQAVKVEDVISTPQGRRVLSTSLHPIIGEDRQPLGATVFARDITAHTEAQAKLAELHRTLMDVSRQAGMAEMAVGVLHHVGNTLNSVNVSAMLLDERLRSSRVKGLARASSLIQEHTSNLAAFLTSDERGRHLPRYFSALSDQLQHEQVACQREVQQLLEGLDHMKSIVSMQQEQARVGGMVELVPVPQLIDDALRLKSESLGQGSIRVQREYQEVPPILVDRHKLLQILVNLLSNAHHALLESGREDKVMIIRIGPGSRPDKLRIAVADNGTGIAPENLQRIFSQGFTTKRMGHGFGLHISALAAAEMRGTLTCQSAGLGHGAIFTLELPVGARS